MPAPADSRKRVVVFDLGNVFIRVDTDRLARELNRAAAGTGEKRALSEILDPGLAADYERGRLSSAAFFASIRERLRSDVTFESFRRIWCGIFTPIDPMIDCLPELRGIYRLVLLSNTNALHIEYCRSAFPWLDLFHHRVYSFEAGLAKPDPLIFRWTFSRTGIDPEDCFFVDDRIENVETAASLGMTAFRSFQPGILERFGNGKVRLSVRELLLGPGISAGSGVAPEKG
ncbi:HAD family phosphatase [bacterium]|nr:HAD family phosphatase [bacterium]